MSAGQPPSLLELEVGRVASGGQCVARHEGRVVFVRHALPGELVLARRTDSRGDRARYWRADAVEVLRPARGRVSPACPHARPGGCGGCDWQHASLPQQRRMKAEVVAEQLRRLACVDVPVTVEPVAAGGVDPDVGLGWRTRVRFSVDAGGQVGLLRHRSHEVVAVRHCPIASSGVQAMDVGATRWPGVEALDVVVPQDGEDRLVVVHPRGGQPVAHLLRAASRLPASASLAVAEATGLRRERGRTWVRERVRLPDGERDFRVTGAGFWQVHPGAAQVLVTTVLEGLSPRPGESVLDLYSGSGLFAAALALRVGPAGRVVAVEADHRAATDARRSLHDLPQVRLVEGRVSRVLAGQDGAARLVGPADLVVLDPPRSGAGAAVVAGMAALGPRAVCYVACDPASLARDVALLARHGYRLRSLRAFDLFPMTQHVECVATMVRGAAHA